MEQSYKSWHEQTEPSCDCHSARFRVNQTTDHQKNNKHTNKFLAQALISRILVEFMHLVFTRMPGEHYRRPFGSLLSFLCDTFQAPINSVHLLIDFKRISPLNNRISHFNHPKLNNRFPLTRSEKSQCQRLSFFGHDHKASQSDTNHYIDYHVPCE